MYGDWQIFIKGCWGVENNSDDDTHQFIISEGTQLTIYNDGTKKNNALGVL
ncbi:hypothetical protein [Butyrivibrio sp. MB2005]|uniref:hypothetical protein n=1 Tax=Butyrivibrio sp. MB2005 TaxID=1280678 RepID=UPI00041FEC5C|nr:hypothetical protein [Butyrivibrio sp. MB2005]